jgi:hypothetical protein
MDTRTGNDYSETFVEIYYKLSSTSHAGTETIEMRALSTPEKQA